MEGDLTRQGVCQFLSYLTELKLFASSQRVREQANYFRAVNEVHKTVITNRCSFDSDRLKTTNRLRFSKYIMRCLSKLYH